MKQLNFNPDNHLMNLAEFIDLLNSNLHKELIFEYAPNLYVGKNYHLTEIKKQAIDSVDCGGNQHQWNEAVFQLWESQNEKNNQQYLNTNKVLDIISKVHHVSALDLNATVKIEYANALFHKAQLDVINIQTNEHQITVSLNASPTLCKSPESCGVSVNEKQNNSSACTPGSGCC